MNPSLTQRLTGALVAAAVAAGCSHGAGGASQPSPQKASADHGDAAAVARARADSVRHPYTAGGRRLHVAA